MSRRLAAVLVTVFAAGVAAAADPAPGARLNGKDVDATRPLRLTSRDRLETASSPAVVRTAGGDDIRVLPRSVLTHMGTDRGVESFFAVSGTVEGDVGPSSMLGAAASWATSAEGAKARVRIAVLPDGAHDAAAFTAVGGGAWLRFHAVATWLPAGCEATLAPSADGPGSMSFAAAPGNRQSFDVTRTIGDRTHAATVPAGVQGVLADRGGGTRFECRAAPAGQRLRLELRLGGRVVRGGAAGPGATATMEGDGLRIDVPALPAGLLRSLLALDREFATLASE